MSSSFRSSNTNRNRLSNISLAIQNTFLQNSKYYGDQEVTQQNISQMTSFHNVNQASPSADTSGVNIATPNSHIDYKLKQTIQKHYENRGNGFEDNSQIDMANYNPGIYERNNSQIMNIHTQPFNNSTSRIDQSSFENNGEEINILQAIQQTNFEGPEQRENRPINESLNYSNSRPGLSQNIYPLSSASSPNFPKQEYKERNQSYYSEASKYSRSNKYDSLISKAYSERNESNYISNEESELLPYSSNQENYNSMNMPPKYQPFNQRFIVKEQPKYRESSSKKTNSSKFDYEPRNSCFNEQSTDKFNRKFYNQSKEITMNMKDKVMKMLEEKNGKKKKSKFKSKSKQKFLKPPTQSYKYLSSVKGGADSEYSIISPTSIPTTGVLSPFQSKIIY